MDAHDSGHCELQRLECAELGVEIDARGHSRLELPAILVGTGELAGHVPVRENHVGTAHESCTYPFVIRVHSDRDPANPGDRGLNPD